MAAGRGQSRSGAGDFWLNGAGEHHADRVEEDELGMIPDGLGDRVPWRVGDKVRELFDSFAHPELLESLQGRCDSLGQWHLGLQNVFRMRSYAMSYEAGHVIADVRGGSGAVRRPVT